MPSDSSAQRGSGSFHRHPHRCLLSFNIPSLASPPQSRSPSPSAHDTLTLRALVSTKDAGVIIGKAGKNVADLREQTGVKAGVSKVIPGVHERVLTVTGPVEGVAKACQLLQCLYISPNIIFRRTPSSSLNSWYRIPHPLLLPLHRLFTPLLDF